MTHGKRPLLKLVCMNSCDRGHILAFSTYSYFFFFFFEQRFFQVIELDSIKKERPDRRKYIIGLVMFRGFIFWKYYLKEKLFFKKCVIIRKEQLKRKTQIKSSKTLESIKKINGLWSDFFSNTSQSRWY